MRSTWLAFGWIALAAVTSGAVAGDGAACGCPAPVATVRDARVDAILNAAIRPTDPGASVIVIRDGSVLHEAGYGVADLDCGNPNTTGTLFHMASTGKQLTGMAVMMLKEEGRLAYSDPIAKHLPELARFGDAVTILQLLHHVSGIPDYYAQPEGYKTLLKIDRAPTNDDALALLETWGVLGPGDVEWFYSNTGYDLLGTLVQHETSESLDGFLQDRVFVPLGMTSSFSMPNPVRFADPCRARGYERQGGRWAVLDKDPLDRLVGSGSVYSTVHDLFLYDQALYTDELVSQATLADAFQPTVLEDGRVVGYGFGWDLGTFRGKSYTAHSGGWEGYVSFLLRFPEEHLSVILLSNRTDLDPWGVSFKIAGIFLPS